MLSNTKELESNLGKFIIFDPNLYFWVGNPNYTKIFSPCLY